MHQSDTEMLGGVTASAVCVHAALRQRHALAIHALSFRPRTNQPPTHYISPTHNLNNRGRIQAPPGVD